MIRAAFLKLLPGFVLAKECLPVPVEEEFTTATLDRIQEAFEASDRLNRAAFLAGNRGGKSLTSASEVLNLLETGDMTREQYMIWLHGCYYDVRRKPRRGSLGSCEEVT